MTSKSPVRSCEDVDEQALSYAEIKALCAGNPLIKEKMDLDVQVAKLKVLKADHQSQKFRLEDKLLTKFPAEIQEQTAKIAALKSDAEIAAAHPQDKENFCGMVIKDMTYDEKKTAGERLILACTELPNTEEQLVGSYRGFELSLRFDTFHKEHQALLSWMWTKNTMSRSRTRKKRRMLPAVLCWLRWRKRQRKRNPSSLSNPISTRTVMPGERKTG